MQQRGSEQRNLKRSYSSSNQISDLLLCSQKGFKQYGWERAKDLEKNQSELFGGLTIDLAKQMKEKNAQTKE
jgi:hypothetical protein